MQEKDIWVALGRFISFTRISVGRGYIENVPKGRSRPDFGVFPIVVPVVIQLVVSTAFFVVLATKVSSVMPHQPRHHHYDNSPSLENKQLNRDCLQHLKPTFTVHHPHEAPGVDSAFPPGREFTTVIPSCYDGDTCYTTKLSYNGRPLPDMFSSMKIRLLGIDAPELSRAKCGLERCLAQRAKREMERIVESGKGYVLNLQKCKPDKYGGRIVCDILTRKGEVVSDLMLKTGFAVRYGGQKKDFSWCQYRKGPMELKQNIEQCLLDICPWHKSGSPNDCQDALTN